MTTETTDRAEVFSRPAARFDEDGNLEVRASAALGCRRALWYAATGYEPTNPPSDDSLTAMEAGNALEPVVVQGRWSGRVGRSIPPTRTGPRRSVSWCGLARGMLVTGHPDGTVRIPGTETRRSGTLADVPLRGRTGRLPPTATRIGGGNQDAGAGGVQTLAARSGQSAATRRRLPRPPSTRSVKFGADAPRRGDSHDGHRQHAPGTTR